MSGQSGIKITSVILSWTTNNCSKTDRLSNVLMTRSSVSMGSVVARG